MRERICRECPTPCEQQNVAIFHATICARCPLTPPRWNTYGYCAKPQTIGLGDAFAFVAHPIARVIDSVTGSKLQGCAPCGQRQERWNKAVPDITKPFS